MAVEKAPYLNYTEITSYLEDIDNGSEIPLFIVKTNNSVTLEDIKTSNVLKFISYNHFKQHFSIKEDNSYDLLPDSIKELDTIVKDFFVENSMYGENDLYGLSVPYIFMIDVGNNPTLEIYKKALAVSERKRKATVILFPNTEDVEFMKEVDYLLKEETKNGLLRIGYFAVSGQGELNYKFAKGDVARPTINYHGYKDIVEGYLVSYTEDETTIQVFSETDTYDASKVITGGSNILYKDKSNNKFYKYSSGTYTEIASANLTGYEEIIEGFKNGDNFYSDSAHESQLTPNESALYLDKTPNAGQYAYTYDGSAFVGVTVQVSKDVIMYESNEDYDFIIPSTKKEVGGNTEDFDAYCKRTGFISQEVNSSRVAIVEKKLFGKTIARICSTPYYVEPGYPPYMSVKIGIFDERNGDERDKLFGTGIIFGEDDATLSTITPRICLATSTAWGIEDHDARTTDALIHARRNVDYHIRRILTLIAPQLKRNETSVTIRHVQNQVDLYLDSELTKGTIMEYSVQVYESSYNPYKLLVKGKIVPVNSTLAIEFENTVGSPHAIASDYV